MNFASAKFVFTASPRTPGEVNGSRIASADASVCASITFLIAIVAVGPPRAERRIPVVHEAAAATDACSPGPIGSRSDSDVTILLVAVQDPCRQRDAGLHVHLADHPPAVT